MAPRYRLAATARTHNAPGRSPCPASVHTRCALQPSACRRSKSRSRHHPLRIDDPVVAALRTEEAPARHPGVQVLVFLARVGPRLDITKTRQIEILLGELHDV